MAGSQEEEPTQEVTAEEMARLTDWAGARRSGGQPDREPPSLEGPPPLSESLGRPPAVPGAATPPAEPARARGRWGPLTGLAVAFVLGFVAMLLVAGLWLAGFDGEGTPAALEAQAEAEQATKAMAAVVADFERANDAVTALEREVAGQEREVAQLQRQLDEQGAAGREQTAESRARREALERKLASARTALETSRAALESEVGKLEDAVLRARAAEIENESILAELSKTRDELIEAKAALSDEAKRRELVKVRLESNQWEQLILAAKLAICERGSRGQLEECRAEVEAALAVPHRRARFVECLRKKESRASVHRLEKGTALPKFAEILAPGDRMLDDWYIAYCDPALPEVPGRETEEVAAPEMEAEDPVPSPDAPEAGPAPEPSRAVLLAHHTEIGIETSPAGAVVEVDGQPRGRTPVKLRLRPRSHRISVTLDGAKTTWKVSSDDRRDYCFALSGSSLIEVECRR